MNKYIQIHASDNVAVTLATLSKGFRIDVNGKQITLEEEIPSGHKVALSDLKKGDLVIKYGFPIGHTLQAIPAGHWVNEKNICTNLSGITDYQYTPEFRKPVYKDEHRTFMGYARENGDVGIRNEIWIIPTVGCVNGIALELADRFKTSHEYSGVDAIVAFTHNYGCSQLGDDHENTRKILRNMALHPNAGGVLIVGLGCENNQPDEFRKILGPYNENRIKFLVTQQTENEIEEGLKLLEQIYAVASHDKRTEQPMGKLRIGLKCGGSDGLSGITANPLLGIFSDYLVAQGGSTVLTEVPEMFGAETLLMNRCKNAGVFERTVRMINNFKDYFLRNNQPIYENPSPGNKAGGISTLEEKSLGCTQKSGSSIVQDVLEYGERISETGLTLLSAPGNDLVASTALAASGCHMVLFTTGRGTPFGTFVPTMKISTNSTLYQRKKDWIDFNAGQLVESETMETLAPRFIDYVLSVASGKRVQNEIKSYREIAIFKQGVTL